MSRPVGFSLSGICALHLATLFTLSVAHPLYDVLGRDDHSSFFAVHRVGAADIWLLVALLSAAIPLAAFAILWIVRWSSSALASGLYLAILFVLCCALFAAVLGRFLPERGVAPAALACAAFASLLYVRRAGIRRFVTWMSPSIVLSPALFLASSSIGSFLSASDAIREDRIFADSELPSVVLIIFDELPQTSLLDANREIDRGRYPNFAELVDSSTWYRNATTLHFSTWIAVPAILTGSDFYAYSDRLHLGDLSGKLDRRRLPYSLFSLLERTHRIVAMESFTDLAPVDSAVPDFRPPLSRRFPDLLLDASILYGHIAAPPPWKARLPGIYAGWQEIASDADTTGASDWPYLGKKAEEVEQFIGRLLPATQPTFYFVHFSLPHFPFTYNEVGQLHDDPFRFPDARFRKATGEVSWASETVADLAYQAHLLQLGFTDVLLGRIVGRLRELDLFDDSLIVITSDHGTSFYWDEVGLPPEELIRVQASDTLHVPLIVKAPGQKQGEVVDRPVQLVDIVPTIAEMLGVEVPWEVDGVSALADGPGDRAIAAYLNHQSRKVEVGSLAEGAERSLKRKLEVFGAGDFAGVYAHGPQRQLVGEPVDAFPAVPSEATVGIVNPGRFRNVDPTAPRLPAYVKGEIRNFAAAGGDHELDVAIAINELVAATARTTPIPVDALVREPEKEPRGEGVRYFLVRIPPAALAPGRNAVSVLGVARTEAAQPPTLIRFSSK